MTSALLPRLSLSRHTVYFINSSPISQRNPCSLIKGQRIYLRLGIQFTPLRIEIKISVSRELIPAPARPIQNHFTTGKTHIYVCLISLPRVCLGGGQVQLTHPFALISRPQSNKWHVCPLLCCSSLNWSRRSNARRTTSRWAPGSSISSRSVKSSEF